MTQHMFDTHQSTQKITTLIAQAAKAFEQKINIKKQRLYINLHQAVIMNEILFY